MNCKAKTGTRLAVPILIMILGSCVSLIMALSSYARIEYGPELTGSAEITEVAYTPGTGITPLASIDIPEVFAVVFKFKHGKIIVNRKDVWEKAKTGMAVTVHYREVYKVLGEERRLIKYDFLGFKDNVEVYAERSAHP